MGKQIKVLAVGKRRSAPQKHVIEICYGNACKSKRAAKIHSAVEKTLETASAWARSAGNAQFCVWPASCLGLCKQAPTLLINAQPFTGLTPEKASKLVAGMAADSGTNEIPEAC